MSTRIANLFPRESLICVNQETDRRFQWYSYNNTEKLETAQMSSISRRDEYLWYKQMESYVAVKTNEW